MVKYPTDGKSISGKNFITFACNEKLLTHKIAANVIANDFIMFIYFGVSLFMLYLTRYFDFLKNTLFQEYICQT